MGASKIPKGRAFFAWQIRFFSRCGRLSGCPVRPAGRIRKANSRLIEPGICLFAGWGQRLSLSRTWAAMRWLRLPMGMPRPSVTFIELCLMGTHCGVCFEVSTSVAR